MVKINGGILGVSNQPSTASVNGFYSLNSVYTNMIKDSWRPDIILDGLSIRYEPSRETSYPGSGATVIDLAGTAQNGTFVNNTSFSTVGLGSFYFDGSGDYISIGNLGTFYPNGSISFWINSTSVSNYRNPFTTKLDGGNSGIRFEQNSAGVFGVVIGNDAATYSAYQLFSSNMPANEWINFCIAWDTSLNIVHGYVDGQNVFSNSHSLWPTTMPNVVLGRGYSTDPARHFQGYMGQFLMYNKTLSANEVFINYSRNFLTSY